MFHQGDRVEVHFSDRFSTKDLKFFSQYYAEGECGTVIEYGIGNDERFTAVVFDDYNKCRHSHDGACAPGYGYWVFTDALILEDEVDCGVIDLSKILEVKMSV